jgi:NHLM bacteriocin system ABC transporter peptidase/ATP-binding protein
MELLRKRLSAAAARLAALRASWLARSTRRANAPLILQMEAVECGAASLAMILAYHKKFVSLEQLRVDCGVTRDGSKASYLVKAARRHGLLARGLRAEPAALRGLPLPMIVFWEFNHFLVVDGFAKGRVLLNDPGFGRRRVTDAEFDKSFTGVVLAFAPGPGFVPSGRPRSLVNGLRRRLTGCKTALAYLVLAGLALVLPGMVIPVFTSVFIDRVLVGSLEAWTVPLVCAMMATALIVAALTWLQKHYLLKLETRISLSTSARFLWHALRLPVGFYHQRSAGDIGVRVGIGDRVAHVLSEQLVTALLGVGSALFFAVVMMLYDGPMSLVTIGIIALNILLLHLVSRSRIELNQKIGIERSKVVGTAMNGLMLIETLKASGSESAFFSRWAGLQAHLSNSTQRMGRSVIVLDLLPKFLAAINSALVLCIGGSRVMHGDMTIGMLVAYQALVAGFVSPVNVLVALGGELQTFKGDMDRLDDVLDHPCQDGAAAEGPPGLLHAARLEGELELRNVTFGYSRHEAPLLENFSLVLRPGQRVALVGASGCGKSTIAKLVIGLYAPWEGQILFDGKPREAWPHQQLLNSMAAVDQDIALFSGTVRDNLAMWDATLPQAAIVDAAKDACVHDAISARPGGYDGRVAQGGANFSGGQRQRLEIARALASNPRLLVFDEATSALDPLTEKTIETNLRRRGCSCLVIAHRLSAVRDCDEIIVLDKGRVVERGSHRGLLALDGNYGRLIANE